MHTFLYTNIQYIHMYVSTYVHTYVGIYTYVIRTKYATKIQDSLTYYGDVSPLSSVSMLGQRTRKSTCRTLPSMYIAIQTNYVHDK